MKQKSRIITNWVLAALVGFIFIGSAIMKLTGGADGLKMASDIGLSPSAFKAVGIVELISIILFLIPRTGVLGTLLLASYMGGAIATHLTHGLSIIAPVAIAAFVYIVGAVRFPELRTRLLGK
jgi:DoxX-like family